MLVLLFRTFTAEPHGVLHLLAADVAELPLDGGPACEIRNSNVEKLIFNFFVGNQVSSPVRPCVGHRVLD